MSVAVRGEKWSEAGHLMKLPPRARIGVDTASTRTLCGLLQWLCSDRGVTVFFTSHVLEMAERLCDRALKSGIRSEDTGRDGRR